MLASAIGRSDIRLTSARSLGLFRIVFGLCLALDILELLQYSALWFDPLPGVERASPLIIGALSIWMASAIGLCLGLFTRSCSIFNYVACVGFLGFAAMPHGYEYHNDNLYLLLSFGVMFMPVSQRYAMDAKRRNIFPESTSGNTAKPRSQQKNLKNLRSDPEHNQDTGHLPGVFLALVASAIYFDSAIWKLSSQMWIEGLGYWTPGTQPLDAFTSLDWTLESEWFARGSGYLTLAYELLFPVLIWFRKLRFPLLVVGAGLHLGIGTLLPLPLFGLLMLGLLAAFLPLRDENKTGIKASVLAGTTPQAKRCRTGLIGFFVLWGSTYLAGLVDPILLLARHGVGGVRGPIESSWLAQVDRPMIRIASAGMTWSYRLFGFRSHAIFIDNQFAECGVQTRLLYEAPPQKLLPRIGDPNLAPSGNRPPVNAPNRNRRFVSWTYHMTWPGAPLALAESWLLRFGGFHAWSRNYDLNVGRIVIEQRDIEMPIDRWRPGVRAQNLQSAWREVGSIRGPLNGLRVEWNNPVWSSRNSQGSTD